MTERKKSLKPGEKIMFTVFGAFFVLAVVGYVVLETVRAHSTEPMFASLSSYDLSTEGKQGSVLFRESGCTSCHNAMRNGTNNGLSLNGLGSRRSLQWINSFLRQPEETYGAVTVDHGYGPRKEAFYVESMPNEELNSIAIFLSELKAKPGSSMSPAPPPGDSSFIDAMVEMWAPDEWKENREDIRVKLKREAEQAERAQTQ